MSAGAKPLRIGLVAGEPSGDRLGAALMAGLRTEAGREMSFVGVGGAAMRHEGLQSLFPIADITVMGFSEVAARLPLILKRLSQTREALAAADLDAIVTIDAPAFGLRVVDQLRRRADAAGARRPVLVHYVAPSVWAWRPKRAEKLARSIDHLLALLPFEPPYFQKVGLSCDFVGHPVVARVRARLAEAEGAPGPALRAELDVPEGAPVIAVLLGSRRSEVERLAGPFGAAAALLAERRPDVRFIAPMAENVADLAAARLADWPVEVALVDPRGRPFVEAERRKFQAFAAADAALAASGSVSLELAALRCPMVIGYRVSWLSAAIARRLLSIDTATLVNLVSETRAVPEFIQEFLEPGPVAAALEALLDPGGAERQAQAAAAELTMARLGEGDAPAAVRAARSVLAAVARGPQPQPRA